MGKRPAIQLYTGDWLKDPCLRRCTLSTKGFWIDMMCLIDQTGDGSITAEASEFARMVGCSRDEAKRAIDELERTETANITRTKDGICEIVTIESRRMAREAKERKANTLRKRKSRGGKGVTNKSHESHNPSSSSSSFSPSGEDKERPKIDPHQPDPVIEDLRKIWPRSLSRSTAKIQQAVADALNNSPVIVGYNRELMVKNANLYLEEVKEQDSKAKGLHNWIADGDWNTDYRPRPEKPAQWLGKDVILRTGQSVHISSVSGDTLSGRHNGEELQFTAHDVEAMQ